jgi:hypothetical protein
MTRVAPYALLVGAMLVLSGCEKSTSKPQPAQQTAKPAAAKADPATSMDDPKAAKADPVVTWQKPDAPATQPALAGKPAATASAAADDPFAPVDKTSTSTSSATAVDPQGPALPTIDPGELPDLTPPAVTPVGKDAKGK